MVEDATSEPSPGRAPNDDGGCCSAGASWPVGEKAVVADVLSSSAAGEAGSAGGGAKVVRSAAASSSAPGAGSP
jgi:hypothetical protein